MARLLKDHYFRVVLVLTAVGAALRLHTLGMRSLWMDEARQVSSYYLGNVFIAMHKGASQQQPPLDNVIGWFLAQIFPFSDALVRVPAMISGALLIPLTYIFAKQITSRAVGLAAAFLVTISPFLIRYSQEARPYSIYFALLIFSLIQFLKVSRSTNEADWRTFRWAVFWCLMSRAMSPVVAYMGLFVSVLLLYKEKGLSLVRSWLPRRIFKNLFRVGLWYLPFFAYVLIKGKKYLTMNAAGAHSRFESWLQPVDVLVNHLLPQVYGRQYFVIMILLTLGLAFLFLDGRRDRKKLWLAVFIIVEPIIHTYVFHLSFRLDLHGPSPRYFLYTQPFVFIACCYGIYRVFEMVAQVLQRPSLRWVFLVPVLMLGYASAQKLPSYYTGALKTDYRSAGQYMEKIFVPGRDLFVFGSFRHLGRWEPELYGQGFYFKKDLQQQSLLSMPEVVRKNPDKLGKLYFFLHEHHPDLKINENIFEQRVYHGTQLIFERGGARSLESQALTILGEMLKFYPQDSSRVRVLMALTWLTCERHLEQAKRLIREAQKWAPDISMPEHCPRH